MSWTMRLVTLAGAPSFGVMADTVPSSWYVTSYRLGTYTPSSWAAARRNCGLLQPSRRAVRCSSTSSTVRSSPSPRLTRSMKSAMGSALYMAVPPAMTSGVSPVRSEAWSGIWARFSIFRMAVKAIS